MQLQGKKGLTSPQTMENYVHKLHNRERGTPAKCSVCCYIHMIYQTVCCCLSPCFGWKMESISHTIWVWQEWSFSKRHIPGLANTQSFVFFFSHSHFSEVENFFSHKTTYFPLSAAILSLSAFSTCTDTGTSHEREANWWQEQVIGPHRGLWFIAGREFTDYSSESWKRLICWKQFPSKVSPKYR